MILLWGVPEDPPLAVVARILLTRGEPFAFLDQGRISGRYEFRFGTDLAGTVDDTDLAAVTCAYVRPVDDASLFPDDGDPAGAERLVRARRFSALLTSWLELSPALVVNRFSAQASNMSKLLQMRIIEAHGLSAPPSLATTDPEAARRFAGRHDAVIYKSLSSVRSIVRRLDPADLDRLQHVTSCPTLFQAYVPGDEYRVHVVGRQVFTVTISSPAHDYRYDREATVEPAELPTDIAERCVTLTEALGLAISGIDLRRTPDGRWYCFEVNPSPGFPYFDRADGEPLAHAVADLLASPATLHPRVS